MLSTSRQAIVLAMVALAAFGGCKRKGANAVLTQSYVSPNNLFMAHYPPEFAARPVGRQALMLSRNLDGGRDEAIAFVTSENPISTDIHEFARVVDLAATKDLRARHQYAEVGQKNATCGGMPAVEIVGTWVSDAGLRYKRRACALVRKGRGFLIAYSVAEVDAAADEPMLRDIVDATEFN